VAAEKAWKTMESDSRFTVFKVELPIAINMSKVCGISRNYDNKKETITLDFGENRGGTLELGPEIAKAILVTLDEG
jgi:hypothetical protein